jgi:hypothetical protein
MREKAIREAIELIENDETISEVKVNMGNGFGVTLIKKEKD